MTKNNQNRVDRDAVAERAKGYWPAIIMKLCPGVNETHLRTHHGPCPKCGGDNRFRVFHDFAETGGAICSGGGEGCFERDNGDGFAFLMWYNGWTFRNALQQVAKELGMVSGAGEFVRNNQKPVALKKTPVKPRRTDVNPFDGWQQVAVDAAELLRIVERWSASKPGVDAETVMASEPMVGRWHDGAVTHDVIGFTGWRQCDKTGELIPAALHIYRQDGEWFPKSPTSSKRKNVNVFGSRNSWLFIGGRERFNRSSVVWKVEGLTDGFAVMPILPAHHAAITMTNGCAWKVDSPDTMPPLSVLRSKRVVACGDADVAGQAGAETFASDAVGVAEELFIATLPYSVEKKNGKDLRDWCCEDEYSWSQLRELLTEWNHLLQMRLSLFEGAVRSSPPRTFDQLDATDVGNAAHYAAYARNLLRYNFSWKRWLCWDGMRWRNDDQGRPMTVAKLVLGEMKEDAVSGSLGFVAKSNSRERISAMIDLSRDTLAVTPDMIDGDSWLLNCPNGTVDLRTGELRLHNQEDYITKLCCTPYDADAQAPRWEKFLAEVFEGHEDVIPFLARFFGYCLTGSIEEQKLPVFWGSGSNGKSTLLNTVKAVMGNDYTMQAQSDLLINRKSDGHPTELADLFGKRLVICAETEHGRRLAEAKLKALTGGEPIRARRMREDFWEFLPEFKLVLVTNHRPQVFGTDYGVWRRLLLVPFEQQFDEERKDPELPEKLAAEQSGILTWMVRGCMEWLASGLNPPESILAATKSYADSEDVVGRFVTDCCVVDRAARVRAKDLNARFKRWAEEGGEPPLSPKRVGGWLSANGMERVRSSGVWWHGIGLRDEEDRRHPEDGGGRDFSEFDDMFE